MVTAAESQSCFGGGTREQTGSRKRIWLWRLIILLGIWQSGMILLGVVAPFFLGGIPLQRFAYADHPEIQKLIDSRFSERKELLLTIQEHRSNYSEYLARIDDDLQCLFGSSGPDKPPAFAVKDQWWNACGKTVYVSVSRDWAAGGINAASFPWYTEEAMRWLDAAENYKGYQGSDWRDRIIKLRSLHCIGRHDFEGAARIAALRANSHAGRQERLAESITAVANDPDSFRVFLDMIAELDRSYFFDGTSIRRDLYWKAYDRATTDAERIEVMLLLAADYGDWHAEPEDSVTHSLYTVCAGLANRDPSHTRALSRALTALAEFANRRGERSTAIAMYGAVADQYPRTTSWGVAVFNRGYLLQQSGQYAACVDALKPIFDSAVNDFEPGPHLMEAYRNYRHRSARLIADAYKKMYNYPLAWWWELRAVEDFPYRTWCGTCAWGESRASFYRLLKASAAAGPVVFAAHVVSSPAKNWRLWCLLLVLYFVWRRLRKWRSRIHQRRYAHME